MKKSRDLKHIPGVLQEDQCEKCAMLQELFDGTKKTHRQYWIMTELFVMLHGGDTCSLDAWKKTRLKNIIKDGAYFNHIQRLEHSNLPRKTLRKEMKSDEKYLLGLIDRQPTEERDG